MQFRRQPELHSDGIKVRLFGEEGRNEAFVPAGGYTMTSDVVSCVKNRDLVLLLPRFKECLVSDVSGELKNISVACGWHAATENPAVENSGFLSRLPLLHWIEAKLDRACAERAGKSASDRNIRGLCAVNICPSAERQRKGCLPVALCKK